MRCFQLLFILVFVSACRDAKKFVSIDGLYSDSFITTPLSDSLIFRRLDTLHDYPMEDVYVIIQLKANYYDEAGWLLHKSSTIEPGLNGSPDSIVSIRFLNEQFEYIHPSFRKFALKQSIFVLETTEGTIRLQSAWNTHESPADFIACFNGRNKKCTGVNLISPIVFKLDENEIFERKDIPRFVEIVMISGIKHLSSSKFAVVSLTD